MVSLQIESPTVNEPGGNGDNTTVNVCISVDSVPAGPIDRVGDIVVTFNTELESAGTSKSYSVHLHASALLLQLYSGNLTQPATCMVDV